MLLPLPLPLAFVEGRGYSGVGAGTGTLINPFNGTVIRAAGSGNIRPSGPSLPFYGNAKFGAEAAGSLIKSTASGPWSLLIKAAIAQGVLDWVNFAEFLQGIQDLAQFLQPATGNETAAGPAIRPRVVRRQGGRSTALLNPPTPLRIANEPEGYSAVYAQSGRLPVDGAAYIDATLSVDWMDAGFEFGVDNTGRPYEYRDYPVRFTEQNVRGFYTNGSVQGVKVIPGVFGGAPTFVGFDVPNVETSGSQFISLLGQTEQLPKAIRAKMIYTPENPAEPSYPVPQRNPEIEFEGQTIKRTANNIAIATAVGSEIKPTPPSPTPAYLPKYAPSAVPGAEPVTAPAAEPPITPRPTTVDTPTIPRPYEPTTPAEKVKRAPQPGPTVPLDPAGNPVRPQTPTPTRTPTDQHLVDGKPYTAGNPRADIKSVAKEVGRVEKKLASVLSSPIQASNWLEDLINLAGLVQLILDILDAGTPGGVYTLSSPCVVDEADQRIVSEVEYGGGPVLNRLESKINAVAQLLQVHKDLGQPGCDGPVPSGNVTVTFTEVV